MAGNVPCFKTTNDRGLRELIAKGILDGSIQIRVRYSNDGEDVTGKFQIGSRPAEVREIEVVIKTVD